MLRTLALTAACAAAFLAAPGAPLVPRAAAEDAPAPSGEKITLAVTPAKGLAFATVTERRQSQAIDAGGMQMEMQETEVEVERNEVTDVGASGDVTIRSVLARAKASASNPFAGNAEFDSESPGPADGNPLAAKYLKRLGKERTVVRGRDGATKSATDENDRDEPNFLPSGPVGAGDSWKVAAEKNSEGMLMKLDLKLTLRSFDAETATIAFTGTVDVKGAAPGAAPEQAAQLAAMKFSDGKIEGTMKLSRKDGLPLSNDVTMTMKMKMEADEAQGRPEVAVDVTMKQTDERKPASFADRKPDAPAPEAKPAETK